MHGIKVSIARRDMVRDRRPLRVHGRSAHLDAPQQLLDVVPGRGIPEAVDIIRVRHVSGGVSTIGFKAYSDGRTKFQGESLAWVWFDEEPPADIYYEGLTRTNVGSGPVWMTFTPLLGMSEVVRRFLLEKSIDRYSVTMTIDDAVHFSDEEKQKIIASYQPHEIEARTKGVPVLGSGRIFPVPEADIACDPIEIIPPHWGQLIGVDFGYDHPFAAVHLAHDKDADVVYVTKCHRVSQQSPAFHASVLRGWSTELPIAWPRDGKRETLEGAGVSLAKQYKAQGLNMLYQHAQFPDGSVSVEAGIMAMLDRLRTGRLRVYRHLNDWFEEFRLYHRKDGRVEKEGDDLMSATRYGIMMLRSARPAKGHGWRKPIIYDDRGYI